MPYKAKIEIGGYKPGEIVPDSKAEIWATMYDESPVEKIGKEKEKPRAAPKKEEKVSSSEIMIDDYLDRNQYVVSKNVKKDNLDIKTLNGLLKHEKAEKGRKRVIRAIKDEMKKEVE